MDNPPIVLIHGAANSALVWKFWQQELAKYGWTAYAVDLRGHGQNPSIDLSHTTMNDYTIDVLNLYEKFNQAPILIGWSMGGLIAMMAAATKVTTACITLGPSTPAQVINPDIALRVGEFTSEEYGIKSSNPETQPTMPDLDLEERQIALASLCRESQFARDERKRGIVIKSLTCPLLLVTGSLDEYWPKEYYKDFWLATDHFDMEGCSHWGLVLNRRIISQAIPMIIRWIMSKIK